MRRTIAFFVLSQLCMGCVADDHSDGILTAPATNTSHPQHELPSFLLRHTIEGRNATRKASDLSKSKKLPVRKFQKCFVYFQIRCEFYHIWK